jgi:hypothetical protein
MSTVAARAMLLRRAGGASTTAAAATTTGGGGGIASVLSSPRPTSSSGGRAAVAAAGARVGGDHGAGFVDHAAPSGATPVRGARPPQQQQWHPPSAATSRTVSRGAVGGARGSAGSALGLGASGGGGVFQSRGGRSSGGGGAAGFGFAARGLSTDGKGVEFEDDDDEAAARAMVGKEEFGGIDPDDLPADDLLPVHMTTPSWLRKKPNRAQKGSYDGRGASLPGGVSDVYLDWFYKDWLPSIRVLSIRPTG